MCFKSILKISHSNYLSYCSNLPLKFAIFLKSSLLFNSFHCVFLFINKIFWHNNFKTRTAINSKISDFVIYCSVIKCLLSYNLNYCNFKNFRVINSLENISGKLQLCYNHRFAIMTHNLQLL